MVARTTTDPRVARRAARVEQVMQAAWAVAGEDGLAALSLHEVARRVGIRQPSLYAYVDSKAGLYDAMFAQAATELLAEVTSAPPAPSPRETVVEATRRIVRFATDDSARFHLLFLRTVPNFEPGPESYAPSVQLAAWLAERLSEAGMDGPADFDVYTALVVGLVVQQDANEPGSDRWTRHLDTVLEMFFTHRDRRDLRGPTSPEEGLP